MMGYCMIRFNKIKKNGLAKVQNHNNQEKEHHYALEKANEDFHPENVQHNITLRKSNHYFADVKEILENEGIMKEGMINGKKPRKDAVWGIESVVIYSPEITPNLLCYLHKDHDKWKKEHKEMWEAYCALNEDERRQKANAERRWVKAYAEESTKWIEKNIGPIISAEIHFSETTPHLHVVSTPIHEKDGRKTLSAKDVLGAKGELARKQTSFAKEVGEKYGLSRGEPKGIGEQKKRKTKFEWEIEKLQRQIESKEKTIQKQEEQITEMSATIANQAAKITELNEEKENAQLELDEVNEQIEMCEKAYKELHKAHELFMTNWEKCMIELEMNANILKQRRMDKIKAKFDEDKGNIEKMIKQRKITPQVFGSIGNLNKPIEDLIKEEEKEKDDDDFEL